ncbi:hypothetical protein ACH41E_34520 [Streptomyces sp. NPDC020412]|uniref:hypothetical protein n=1 Tax=Streptomyces sp. NPDC020412 TaxID=3365073 RepID=UPI0037A36C00
MNDVPDIEITGDVYKYNLEIGSDGKAVLVAYTKDEKDTIGRCWIRFDEGGTQELKRRAERF